MAWRAWPCADSTAPAYDSSAPAAVLVADDASCHRAGCGANRARNASAAEPVQCALSIPCRPAAVSPKEDENLFSWEPTTGSRRVAVHQLGRVGGLAELEFGHVGTEVVAGLVAEGVDGLRGPVQPGRVQAVADQVRPAVDGGARGLFGVVPRRSERMSHPGLTRPRPRCHPTMAAARKADFPPG